jgi:CheY-like chemotaxis protein
VGSALVPALAAGPADDDPARLLRQRHAGARVLVVEDNAVNREVAESLLQVVGLVACSAETGLGALQLLAGQACDLVLMDVQLPGMDGLEATRRIRRDPALAHLPVVAMTANAFAEDRQACLAAGMDDFVAKPVQPTALYAALLRGLAKAGQRRPGPVPAPHVTPLSAALPVPSPTPRPPAGCATRAVLTSLLGDEAGAALARLRGDAPRLLRLLRQFVQRQQPDAQRLLALLLAGQATEARALAHELKGAAGTLGAARLAERALAVEAGLRQGEPAAALLPQAQALQAEMQRLADALAAMPAQTELAEAA